MEKWACGVMSKWKIFVRQNVEMHLFGRPNIDWPVVWTGFDMIVFQRVSIISRYRRSTEMMTVLNCGTKTMESTWCWYYQKFSLFLSRFYETAHLYHSTIHLMRFVKRSLNSVNVQTMSLSTRNNSQAELLRRYIVNIDLGILQLHCISKTGCLHSPEIW